MTGLVGRLLARRRKHDDVMALADACQSGTQIYDALATEMRFDPIDPVAVERIKARVEDELAARRGPGAVSSDIAVILRNVAISRELMEIGRKAIEDELIEWRDSHRWMAKEGQVMRANGFAVREVDGTPSSIIRFGPEVGVRIALRAIAEHLDAVNP